MALPVWAYFMKKVYRNKSLGYDVNMPFDIPEDFNPCQETEEDPMEEVNGIEEVFE